MLKMTQLGFLISLVLCFQTAQASVIHDLVIFGDSLSDSGNLYAAAGIPGAPYVEGRFTNGHNYADYLGESLSIEVTPSLLGGHNFAWGGARARSDTPISGGTIPGLATQVNAYLATQAGAPVPSDVLSIIYIGNNDIADAIDANLDTTQAALVFDLTIQQILSSIQLLKTNGADDFLIPLTPDWSMTPRYLNQSNAQMLTLQFNQMFTQAILDLNDPTIHILDTPQIFNDNLDQFANITTACLAVGCLNPEDYLFFDSFHPTTQAHKILSDAIQTAISIPVPNTLLLVMLVALFIIMPKRSLRFRLNKSVKKMTVIHDEL